MADTHHINGHDRRSHAERIAHLTGGRLADGIAVSFAPPPQIGIGRFTMRGLPAALGGPGPVTIEVPGVFRTAGVTIAGRTESRSIESGTHLQARVQADGCRDGAR